MYTCVNNTFPLIFNLILGLFTCRHGSGRAWNFRKQVERNFKSEQNVTNICFKLIKDTTEPNPFAGNFEAGSKNGKTNDVKSEKSRKFRFFFVFLLCEMFNLCLDKLS